MRAAHLADARIATVQRHLRACLRRESKIDSALAAAASATLLLQAVAAGAVRRVARRVPHCGGSTGFRPTDDKPPNATTDSPRPRPRPPPA